jgi:hypothetical protein
MIDWQSIIAWGFIVAASLYVVHRMYRRVTRVGKPSSCGSCSAAHSKLEIRPLLQIQVRKGQEKD